MLINEQLLDAWFDGEELVHYLARGFTYVAAIVGVLGLGWLTQKRQENNNKSETYVA
jgi:hypothetical protein